MVLPKSVGFFIAALFGVFTLSWMVVRPQERQGQDANSSFEVRDESGEVRCRVGKLADGSYGLELRGERGTDDRVVLRNAQKGWDFSMRSGVNELSVVAGGENAVVTLRSRNAGGLRLSAEADGGVALVCTDGDAVERVKLLSETGKSGKTILELHGVEAKSAKSGVAFIADGKGATIDLLREGRSTSQWASVNSGMIYVLMGARQLGLYLQAARNGAQVIEMCNEGQRVVLQSTVENGAGLGINRANGHPAVRMGVSQDGVVRGVLLDDEGKNIGWESSEGGK